MKTTLIILLLGGISLTGQERGKETRNAPHEIIKYGKDFREELKKKDNTVPKTVFIALKYLPIAETYLANNRQPTTDPAMNVAPPNGGRAGVDPSSIKNPVDRRKYEEAIAANIELINAHNAWREATTIKEDAISLISTSLREDSNLLLDDSIQVLWKQLPEGARQEIEKRRQK